MKSSRGAFEILHRPDEVLVAVLELLSPANKRGEGFIDFCAKRMAILRQKVHLVELDLLLGGQRHAPCGTASGWRLLYLAIAGRRAAAVRSLHLEAPPAAAPDADSSQVPDPDVFVDLQAVFRQAFERGDYAEDIRYDRPPRAPLKKEDRTWAMRQAARKRNGP